MQTTSTFSISLWINASRAKNNLAELYARVTVNGKRVNISLRRKVAIDAWDNTRSRVKGNREPTRVLNRYLDQVRAKLFQCYQDLRAEGQIITSHAIKARFLGEDQKHYIVLL